MKIVARANPTTGRHDDGDVATRARRTVGLFVVVLGSVLGVIAATIFWVNPYGTFASGAFPPLVFESNAAAVEAFVRAEPAPRALILGSSRVARVEPAEVLRLTGLPAFNANLNSARVEEWLAFLRFALETRGDALEMVVLGVDPIAFSDGEPSTLATSRELSPFVPEVIGWRQRIATLEGLLSGDQFRHALYSIMVAVGGASQPLNVLADDGVRYWPGDERAMASGAWDLAAAIEATNRLYGERYGRFDAIAPWRAALFETLVEACADRGIDLVVFIPPFHPTTVEVLTVGPNYIARRAEVVAFVEDLAATGALRFYDFSDRRSYGGDVNDWRDGEHFLGASGRRMLARMLPQ